MAPGSPVPLEALHLLQVRLALLLRLHQRLAHGPSVVGEGEAVGDGLHLLSCAGQIALQICGAKTVLEGWMVPASHPVSPNCDSTRGGCPHSVWQRHSPWVTCAILSTASSGMELKVPLPCKERGRC